MMNSKCFLDWSRPDKFVKEARQTLGLSQSGLARALRLGADGGRTVRRWESGEVPVSGPVQLAIEFLLTQR